MAKITKWAIFWRAFFFALIFGNTASAQSQAEVEAWNRATESGKPEDFFRYLSLFPAGAFVENAVEALDDLGEIDGGLASGAPTTPQQQRSIVTTNTSNNNSGNAGEENNDTNTSAPSNSQNSGATQSQAAAGPYQ